MRSMGATVNRAREGGGRRGGVNGPLTRKAQALTRTVVADEYTIDVVDDGTAKVQVAEARSRGTICFLTAGRT